MQNLPPDQPPTPPAPTSLALSTTDLDILLLQLAAPQIQACASSIVDCRLWLDLTVDTGISLLGRLPVTLSLLATFQSPTTIIIDIQMIRAMGVAGIVRHFLKSIIQHTLPPDLRPIVEVESNTRLLVHLDKIQLADHPLSDLLTLHSITAPAAPHALSLTFTLQHTLLPHLLSIIKSPTPIVSRVPSV